MWYGGFLGAGVDFTFRRFTIGASARLSAVEVENGWHRFGRDEVSDRITFSVLTAGPRIAFSLDRSLAIESSLQFGHQATFAIGLAWKF